MTRADIWLLDLDVSDSKSAAIAALLSPDEVARADQLINPIDARRYKVRRGQIRQILAGYVGGSPADIGLITGEYGKPRLKNPQCGFHFNSSHSGGVMMLAISPDCEIGVDIERIEPVLADVVEVALTPRERAGLATVRPKSWLAEFYKLWTCKEAVLKAHGTGLQVDPTALDVRFAQHPTDDADGHWGDVDWHQFSSTARPQRVYAFTPRPGFSAAISAVAVGQQLAMSMRHPSP